MRDDVERAVEAIRRGRLAVFPTDTVYGIAAAPEDEAAIRELSVLKGRSADQPIALVAASVGHLLTALPELTESSVVVARALLPGPYTLVLENPEHRYAHLAGAATGTIGVRVPAASGPGRDFLEGVGVVAATSANVHGGRDPRRLEDVPAEIRAACATVDGGELPGTPSTVLDLTGATPRVLREGAVSAAQALERVAAALDG